MTDLTFATTAELLAELRSRFPTAIFIREELPPLATDDEPQFAYSPWGSPFAVIGIVSLTLNALTAVNPASQPPESGPDDPFGDPEDFGDPEVPTP